MNCIAYYRKKLGLTQKAFAEIIGISTSTVAMYETNKRVPNIYLAQQISNLLGADINILFSNVIAPEIIDNMQSQNKNH